ncbi:hypothetical protein [Pyrodictium delaneyi]|uniref:hypothetical protein n=1 Tax=Pyrodictium delaneyi TaxID=1273541 RepID=UPI0012E21380|nr:hypothetical protein [Pyrodictium delaneyi]
MVAYRVAETAAAGLWAASLFFLASSVPALMLDTGGFRPQRRGRIVLRAYREALLYGAASALPLVFAPFAPYYLRAAGLDVREVPLYYVSLHAAGVVLPPLLAPYPVLVALLLAAAPLLVYTGVHAAMLLGLASLSLAGALDEILYAYVSKARPSDPLLAGALQTARNLARAPASWLGGALYSIDPVLHVSTAALATASMAILLRPKGLRRRGS